MAELSSSESIMITVEARAHGWRIDHYLTRLYPNYSRAAFQKAIAQETILLNGLPVKSGRRLRVNDALAIRLPETPDERTLPAEDIPLEILYEDEYLVVINKAADMIVHPGRGNYLGTLAGALQFHLDSLSDAAGKFRPGIVHRLDRNTTGVIVVAKDNQVHGRLSAQFEQREVQKEYRALVWGSPEFDSDYIETHIRTHPKVREKMQVCGEGGNARTASTYYEVLGRFEKVSYMRLRPKTGRTHQLRVHMKHLGHSILADSMYDGGESVSVENLFANRSAGSASVPLISRPALHAYRLAFRHPHSGKDVEFHAPLPPDMQAVLDALEAASKASRK
ncbi:MAG: RluA family pseudouridine synthase [Planctomycetota bacterium]|nr:RluA family pseudouridine synthase [Planctomycetota bacterium]MDA1248743.1 RluA family pseudouridine synthase [Planctomycetota bacterium]